MEISIGTTKVIKELYLCIELELLETEIEELQVLADFLKKNGAEGTVARALGNKIIKEIKKHV